MPRRRAHRTKNIRIADFPCFDLFADHRISLFRERLLARAQQGCCDQAGRNEKSWAALNDISPPTHPSVSHGHSKSRSHLSFRSYRTAWPVCLRSVQTANGQPMPAPATTRIRLFHIVSKQKLELSNFRLLGDCTEWRMEVVAGEVLVAFERVVDDWTRARPSGRATTDGHRASGCRPRRGGSCGRFLGGLRRSCRGCHRGRRTVPPNSAGFVRRARRDRERCRGGRLPPA